MKKLLPLTVLLWLLTGTMHTLFAQKITGPRSKSSAKDISPASKEIKVTPHQPAGTALAKEDKKEEVYVIFKDYEEYLAVQHELDDLLNNPGKYDEDPQDMKEKDPSFKHRDVRIAEFQKELKRRRAVYYDRVSAYGYNKLNSVEKDIYDKLAKIDSSK